MTLLRKQGMTAAPAANAVHGTGNSTTSTTTTTKRLAKFGRDVAKEFPFDPEYHNMNHGSFGSIPKAVQSKLRDYQDQCEARPDLFIRFTGPKLIDESRAAVAKILRAPVESVVLASNATTALNIILRNMTWNPDGNDEIIYFNTIYGSCGKTIDYIIDTHPLKLTSREIAITYPAEDADIVASFRAAVAQAHQGGRRPRVCVFDTVSSLPGVRFPFEAMTAACRELGVLSLIDGAQGIGMIDIDLASLDPDFFLSNCHKWLHVPRGCAVLYVPPRHQALMVSTLPTSHGYIPQQHGSGPRSNPFPPSKEVKSHFVKNFEYCGTVDSSPYFCIKDAVRWREEALGGEQAIVEYCQNLAREGGVRMSEILGTRVLENKAGTLWRCAMTNVKLPLKVVVGSEKNEPRTAAAQAEGSGALEGGQGELLTIPAEDVAEILAWFTTQLLDTYHTFVPTYFFQGEIWARVSAQVYLDMDDFEWTGRTLLELAGRAAKGEYKHAD